MATTYSQSVTGVNAGSPYQAKVYDVPDTDVPGNVIGSLAAAQGGNMSRGAQLLVKNPDGSQSNYVIDAERSIPGVSLILRKV